MPLEYNGRFSIFDDIGEVKGLVYSVIRRRDPEVAIERIRKLDFSFVFTLFKKGKRKEVELSRTEIDASWNWREGRIDDTLQKKIEDTIAEF